MNLPGYVPAVVLVEVLEGGVEVLFPVHPVHVHRRRDELLVVDRPAPVGVGLDQEIKAQNAPFHGPTVVIKRPNVYM